MLIDSETPENVNEVKKHKQRGKKKEVSKETVNT